MEVDSADLSEELKDNLYFLEELWNLIIACAQWEDTYFDG